MNRKDIIEERDAVVSQMIEYCDQYKVFFELDTKLKNYSDFLYDFQVDDIHKKRQALIKEKIDTKLRSLFGENYKSELNVNLDTKLALNIADHHQILNHPFLVSSNIISSTDKLNKDKKQEAIVVISSGDVPPNNYFSKNGFTFHDKRVPLFSNSERESVSYYLPSRDFDFVEKLKITKGWKAFSEKEKDFLIRERDEITSYDFSKCKNYIDQMTIIVKNSWPRLFEEKLRKNLPELIYITQEELVTDCLVDILEEDNIVSRCIFDEDFRNEILENFRGIVVTWDEKEGKGTHFFWQKHPTENKSLRMYIKDNYLVPVDERYEDLSIKIDQETIINLLKERKIYPSLFMIFAVINFYLGVKPLVGYGSVIYLNLMKNAWIKTLDKFELKEEVELIKGIKTNGLVAGLPLVFEKHDEKIKALFAYDIFFKGGITEEYLNNMFDIKFKDFLTSGCADMYDYFSVKYVPEEFRLKFKSDSNDFASLIFNSII